jgi:outer membrane protein assembly factor BamB
VTWNGVRQYVQMTGKSVAGIAADDGRLLWKYNHESRTAAVPTPVIKDDEVYVTSGYGAGCDLIKVSANGTGFKCEEVYSSDVLKNMINHHGGVVRVGYYVYGFSGDNARNPDEWICQEFETGKIAWHEKKMEKGSVTCADGHLYLYGEKTGAAVLIEANPKEWKETGRFTIPRKSADTKHQAIWTHPTVANGRLYLRDQELIFCYDVKEK